MTVSPELLYLLSGDPAEFAEVVAGMEAAEVVEALRNLAPTPAAGVIAALPFDLAVQVLDDPELPDRASIVRALDVGTAGGLLDAMAADQQAMVFRELPETERARLLPALHRRGQEALTLLLQYPPEKAGGIMTTEFLSVPPTWTVEEALQLIRRVGRAKETVYEVYIVDPDGSRLRHVVSLRELVLSDRGKLVTEIGSLRKLVTVDPDMDREDVARLISKYNLLALPVVDQAGRILGIVTVDDVIDALVAEQTEDVQKLGGLEALDEPYTQIGFWAMIRKLGSLTGSMLPFVLKRLGFDPASASAPFVATLVDVTGIVIYFTIAAVVLRGTVL